MFYLPPGTVPPMVMPFDPTASVPRQRVVSDHDRKGAVRHVARPHSTPTSMSNPVRPGTMRPVDDDSATRVGALKRGSSAARPNTFVVASMVWMTRAFKVPKEEG